MTTENQGTCADFEESLELLLDDELEGEALTRFESHLENCTVCGAELVVARRLREALAAVPVAEAPDDPVAAVLTTARAEAMESAASKTSTRFRWVANNPYLTALAALLAIAIGLSWILAREPEAVEPTTAEVERATLETKLALAHVARASRQIGLEIEQEVSDRWLAPTVRRFRSEGTREPRGGESTPPQERG